MLTRIITDESEFAALHLEWDAVLSASLSDGPFLRHGWIAAWWGAFGCGQLAVVTCRERATGELLGVLPAYRCRIGLVGPSRVFRLLGDGKGGSTGLGAFALPHAEKAVWDATLQALLAEAGSWDSVELCRLSDDGAYAGFAAEKLGDSGAVGAVRSKRATLARPCVDLPSTWEEYLSTLLNHDERHKVRRCLRRGDALGAEVELFDDAERLPDALDEAISIHEERMRHVVSPDYALSAAQRVFVHSSCGMLHAEQRLRLAFLVVDGQRVACECQMRYADTNYAMWTGFRDDWESGTVGRTLFASMVRQAIADGCTVLDIGLGEQQYKSSWGVTRVERFGSLRAYAGTMRGRFDLGRETTVEFAQRTLEAAPPAVRKPLWGLAQGARRLVGPR